MVSAAVAAVLVLLAVAVEATKVVMVPLMVA
jgi:hypothetical protein